jgi:hypothetical protein
MPPIRLPAGRLPPRWLRFRKLFMAHAPFAIVKYWAVVLRLPNCSSGDGRNSGGRANATQTTDEQDVSCSIDPSRIDERIKK